MVAFIVVKIGYFMVKRSDSREIERRHVERDNDATSKPRAYSGNLSQTSVKHVSVLNDDSDSATTRGHDKIGHGSQVGEHSQLTDSDSKSFNKPKQTTIEETTGVSKADAQASKAAEASDERDIRMRHDIGDSSPADTNAKQLGSVGSVNLKVSGAAAAGRAVSSAFGNDSSSRASENVVDGSKNVDGSSAGTVSSTDSTAITPSATASSADSGSGEADASANLGQATERLSSAEASSAPSHEMMSFMQSGFSGSSSVMMGMNKAPMTSTGILSPLTAPVYSAPAVTQTYSSTLVTQTQFFNTTGGYESRTTTYVAPPTNTTYTSPSTTTAAANVAPVIKNAFSSINEGASNVMGTMIATDANGDTLKFSISGSHGQYGVLTVALNSGGYYYALNNNSVAVQALAVSASLTDIINVVVGDGKGSYANGVVSITIYGVNDTPIFNNVARSVAKTSETPVTGTFIAADVDVGDTLSYSANNNAQYGTFTLGANGAYSYTLNTSNSIVQALGDAETLTDAMTVTVNDGHGGVVTRVLSVVIGGSNDAPILTTVPRSIAEDNGTALTGILSATDINTSDTLTFAANNNPVYGALSLNAVTGAYSYTLNNANSTVQALNAGQTLTDVINVTVSDGKGGNDVKAITITITGTNDAPILNNITGDAVNFTEGASPVAIDQGVAVTVFDIDNANFNGGNVTVAYASGGGSADQLTVANQGTGAGQISVSGSTISYQGNAIGTLSGGTNGSSLVVTFNSNNATAAAVQALIQATQYQNISDNPVAARTLSVTVNDGSGGTSVAQTVVVNITPEADAKTLTSGLDAFVTGNEADTFTTSEANFAAGDTLTAGSGTDTLIYSDAANITTAELANKTGIDIIQLGANSTVALSDAFVNASDANSVRINNSTNTVSLDVSNLTVARTAVIGGTGVVTLSVAGKVTSADGVNTNIIGSAGADTLTGGTGNDTLVGGYGGDTISGGAGNDVIYAGGTAFISSTISSLQVWLDAGNLSGNGALTADGAAVATWVDGAGTATNATALNGSATYNTGSIGGRNAITFDGNDNLSLTRNISGNFSIVAVFKTGTAGGAGASWYHGRGIVDAEVAGVTNDFGMSLSSTSAVRAGIGNPDVTVTSSNSGLNNNAGHIAVLQRNQTADSITIGVDNATAVSSSAGGVQALTAPSTIRIGSLQTNINYFVGDIAEVMIFDASITTAQRDTVYQYLANKYSTSVSGFTEGVDTLTGGTGADTFVWTSNSSSTTSARDVITDFAVNDGDKIDISSLVVTPITVLGNAAFSNAANQLIWTKSGNSTIVSLDYGGDGTADWSIKLSNFTATNLSMNDFILTAASVGKFTLTSSTDTFIGGVNADSFTTTNANFAAGDVLTGNAGSDTLVFSNAAAITSAELANKTGIDKIQFNAAGNTVVLSDAFVDASDNNSVELANSTNTITSLDVSGLNALRTAVIGGTGTVTMSAAGTVYSKDGVNTNIIGSTGVDTLQGGTGGDTLYGGAGADTIYGGAGNDILYSGNVNRTGGTSSIEIIYAGIGNDTLYLADNNTNAGNSVYGEAGNDVFVVNYGANIHADYWGSTDRGETNTRTGAGTDVLNLLGAGTNGVNWSVSADSGYTTTDQGGGVTRLTFTAEAVGTVTMNDGSVVRFHEVDYIDYT